MDAGDLATWVGSTFAAIAAGATLWTLKSQRDQIGEQRTFIGEQTRFMDEQRQNLELERAELRAAAEDRRWAQARQVGVGGMMVGDGEGYLWRVTVSNGSDAPIRDLQVKFGTSHTAAEVHELLPAGGRGDRRTLPLYLLGPRRKALFESQSWQQSTAHNHRPTLYFADDASVRWSLDWLGHLQEVSDDAP